jgi:SAM-dependent methyltransferase
MTESNAVRFDARRTLMQLVFGTMATQVLGMATRMDLADAIGDNGSNIDDLAKMYDIRRERINRLVRAFASLGMCVERSPGRFALTDTGSLLRKDNPGSLHDFVQLMTEPVIQEAWLHTESSIRTGRTAFDEVFGMPVFKYFADKPELSALFNSAMSQRTQAEGVATTLSEKYDFSRFSTVVDVGGGDGTLLTAILKCYPHLHGVVFDTVEGVAQAADTVKAAGLSERCTVTAGDVFDSLPVGADLYLLKSVIHMWDDDRAATILERCRAVLPPHGRLLIIEPILPETVYVDASENLYLTDLHMLGVVGGKERTRTDFEQLCTRSGFTVSMSFRLAPQVDFCLIDAAPA